MTDKPKAFSVDHQVKQARDVKRLTKEVQRLRAELDREQRQWIPIDTAPKDGTSILVMNNDQPGCPGGVADRCWAGNTAVAEWWGDGDDGRWVCYMDMIQDPDLHFTPTHWMPLPPPPPQPRVLRGSDATSHLGAL